MTGGGDPAVLRPIRRTPGVVLGVAVAFGIGVGAGAPVLSMLYGAFHREDAYVDPLLNVEPEPGWIGAWTPRSATLRAAQDAELTVLLQVLLGLTALLMMVAVVNMVTLLLVRGAGRRAEFAVRAAVGGTPAGLASQLLQESAVALIGLAVAAAIAGAVHPLMTSSWPGSAALWGRPAPPSVPMLVTAVFLVALLAAWLAPLSSLPGRNLRRYLAGSGRATFGRREGSLRNALVIAQLAALLVLLTGAALLLLAVHPGTGRSGEPGFDPRSTLVVQVALSGSSPQSRAGIYRDALERISRIRGVRGASLSTAGAWVGLGPMDTVWSRCTACWDGGMLKPSSMAVSSFYAVTPGAFQALGAPLAAGREFTAADTGGVAVLSSALALTLFPRGSPVGQQVQIGGGGLLGPGGSWYTVIGVVRPIRARGIGAAGSPGLALYLPALRHPPARMGLAVRTSGDPMRALSAVAGAVTRAGAGVRDPMSMERYLERFAAPMRWFAFVFLGLAAGAVVLATGGLSGVMRYNVARRTREIGIRMAIGAGTRQIGRMVLGQSVRIVAAGVLAGLFGALPLAQGLQSLVRGVRPFDPRLFALIAGTLAIIVIAAALRPARHAARLDPHAALREE